MILRPADTLNRIDSNTMQASAFETSRTMAG